MINVVLRQSTLLAVLGYRGVLKGMSGCRGVQPLLSMHQMCIPYFARIHERVMGEEVPMCIWALNNTQNSNAGSNHSLM